jgi:hypothetical protein
MCRETILVIHLRLTTHSIFLAYEVVLEAYVAPGTRLNHPSSLWIGFMHMLSIVRMLYLSRKSLSAYRHEDKCSVWWWKYVLRRVELLPIEIAMRDRHLISKN